MFQFAVGEDYGSFAKFTNSSAVLKKDEMQPNILRNADESVESLTARTLSESSRLSLYDILLKVLNIQSFKTEIKLLNIYRKYCSKTSTCGSNKGAPNSFVNISDGGHLSDRIIPNGNNKTLNAQSVSHYPKFFQNL